MEIILTCGKNTAVIESVGAEMKSFKMDGAEKTWCGDGAKGWDGHSPVLFPSIGQAAAGEIKDRFSMIKYDGVARKMPFHGLVRDEEFTVAEKRNDSVCLRVTETAATWEGYPFRFALDVIFTLAEDGYSVSYKVANPELRKELMYIIGAHPSFAVDNLEDYEIIFEKEEQDMFYFPNCSRRLDSFKWCSLGLKGGRIWRPKYDDFDKDTFVKTNVISRSVKLVKTNNETKRQTGAELSWDGFEVLSIWTPPGKRSPFVCLEPWQGLPSTVGDTGNYEDKPYLVRLKPQDSKIHSYCVRFF